MNKQPAELPFLLREIEQQSGIDPSCQETFDELCDYVIEKIESLPVPKNRPRNTISKKTLQRTWGKAKDAGGAGAHTLTLLAKIAGYRGWYDFCQQIAKKLQTENPFQVRTLKPSTLRRGDLCLIGNPPHYYIYAKYLGNGDFKALITCNSHIHPDDTFHTDTLYVHPRLDLTSNPLPLSIDESQWWDIPPEWEENDER